MKTLSTIILLFAVMMTNCLLLLGAGQSTQHQDPMGYQDTPMLPGGKWHVHDGNRPQPVKVTAGKYSTEQHVVLPPSDAEVLFGGNASDLAKWKTVTLPSGAAMNASGGNTSDAAPWKSEKGGPAAWKVRDGYLEVAPGTGDIFTREEFGNIQLHVEWRTPAPLKQEHVYQGNSGVFLFGVYELQVFESSVNLIYADGQAGAIYGQYPPLVNSSRDAGEWQTYDVVFEPAHFKDGKLVRPAYITAFQNGVLIQNHTAIMGETGHRISPVYRDRGTQGPIRLQDHGDPDRYRNIWVRRLKEQE